ncbi:XrtB/PEP-CTERM-associated transcriptional regulator EpsA [Pseudorhodoferax sp.]|uniref:XrtB/PEP-CTERM-associated transcriptional regulator EpsA n=1 Tax=Pseudorhodoferax sp. TaxID=1993553 RepID=UPI0039E2DAA9
MTILNSLSNEDRGRCFDLMAEAVTVRTHLDLFNWLRGGMQYFLPHDILVAAWGDFRHGALRYDIVSALPSVRTAMADTAALASRMQSLFSSWSAADRQPYMTYADRLSGVFSQRPLQEPLRHVVPPVRTALVHGLRDERTGQDGLYVALSRYAISEKECKEAMHMLLPCIDAAMRQVPPLPCASTCAASAGGTGTRMPLRPAVPQIDVLGGEPPSADNGMTAREMQIMRWVEMGKTNQEIASILNISAFTVKNHLQRIFKKLDVYNRAQAVSRFKDSYAHG